MMYKNIEKTKTKVSEIGTMSVKSMHRILVTGSTGQIGSELTVELRKRYGADNVVAAGHTKRPSKEFKDAGPFEVLDTSNKDQLTKVVELYDIDTVFHLAAVLSAVGEQNPQLAWKVNLDGLMNVLELAKTKAISKIFWPSSIAVYGPGVPRIQVPQEAPLNPITMYGITKAGGELLCNYYHQKYGVDVRCVRYPGIISSETLPGGGTTDYSVAMFYGAVTTRTYTCFVREDTTLPMMYMPDALRGTILLMEAEPSKVKLHTGYNLAAMSFSAGKLASEIAKHVKGFKCMYASDWRQKIADSWPMSIDDTPAKNDWNWKPEYDLHSMTKEMLEKLFEKQDQRALLLDKGRD